MKFIVVSKLLNKTIALCRSDSRGDHDDSYLSLIRRCFVKNRAVRSGADDGTDESVRSRETSLQINKDKGGGIKLGRNN